MVEIAVLLLGFVLVTGLLWVSGLWGSFISLINIVFAALIATAYFEVVADHLEYGAGRTSMQFTYICDFAAIWLVFVGSAILIRTLTDSFSSIKLKFDFLTEMIGRTLVSLLAAGIFTCFAHFTLLVAPLPLHEGIRSSNPMIPHQLWMNLTRGLSNGSLAESAQSELAQPYRPEHNLIQGNIDIRAFDPLNTFQEKYYERRHRFSQQDVARVNR